MEIPVVAPQDGTVASINVAVGDSVDNGAVHGIYELEFAYSVNSQEQEKLPVQYK